MYIIGIAGGSGSGKSTFSERIINEFPSNVTLLKSDNYYLPQDNLPMEVRVKTNYDSPSAIDFSLMSEHIEALKAGKEIDCPIYDFKIHTRSGSTQRLIPKDILILDGILILADERLRGLLDLKIFVETDADERILRRTRRDVIERGRTIDSVIEQYLATVKPMHYLYVEPSKAHADIIINGGLNDNALELVKGKIKDIIKNNRQNEDQP